MRLDKRNREILEGKVKAYYIDNNLAEKFNSIFECPGKAEIDEWIECQYGHLCLYEKEILWNIVEGHRYKLPELKQPEILLRACGIMQYMKKRMPEQIPIQ